LLHTNGLRDLSERHHTLHSAIDWSYTLLRPDEQRLLARSGVFIGGWTLEAAEIVAGSPEDPPSVSALDILASLVNHNLVVHEERRGEPRFALLETIRAYALERLAERGEEERVRQRHAEYYLSLAEQAEPYLRTAGQLPWLDRLEIESSNLRAALDWFLESAADPDWGLRLAGALGWFWIMRGHVSEGRNGSTRALDRGSHAIPALRAKVLHLAGMLSWPGDLPVARSQVEEGRALFREIAPVQKWDHAHALTGYALIMAYEGDSDAVQSACEEAVALFEELQDKWGIAVALVVLGEAYLLRHEYSGACSRFEESLTLFRETGDRWGIGIPLLNWGYTDSLLGNLDAACARLEESIRMHREVGERTMRSLSLNVLAQVLQQQEEIQQAVALYGESLDLFRRMGIEASAADVLHNLAWISQSQGHFPLAARLYEEGLALFSKQGNEEGIAKCRTGLAAVAAAPEEVGSEG
jgi:tetratricopeptide (TPR) repeat protein